MHLRIGLLLFTLLAIPPTSHSDSLPVFRKTVSEVELTLVASDGLGRPLPVLAPTDIVVLEDGRAIPNFELRAAADLPLRVGIALDLSDSTRSSWTAARNAVSQFLGQLLQPDDEVLLLAFDSQVRLQQSMVGAPPLDNLLAAAAQGGQTALFDALYTACQDHTFRELEEPRRSALIVFSDGEDNLSRHDLPQTAQRAKSAGIAIYTIAIHSRQEHLPGDRVLRQLATSTGGQDFVVGNNRDLGNALTQISRELRASYLLYYHPPNPARTREFRRVLVLPAQNAGPRIRLRRGYFTAPEPDN